MTNVVSLDAYRQRVANTTGKIVEQGNELFYGLLGDLANVQLMANAVCTISDAYADETGDVPLDVYNALFTHLGELVEIENEINQLLAEIIDLASKFHDEVYE